MTKRYLNLLKLLGKKHSAFLFGPRGTGKTTLAEQYLESSLPSISINLLHDDEFNKYLQRPELLRKEVHALLGKQPNAGLTILLDEIQKLPQLLDEVHAIIEDKATKGKVNFLLTGSSARKLKRIGANLLAGRAWNLSLHPLSFYELHQEWDLAKALQVGTLPLPYLHSETKTEAIRVLKSYVGTYLKEEIQLEAQIRNLQAFSRFLEMSSQMNAESVNYSKIAKEVGVTTKTIQEYFQILLDTLIVFKVEGWSHSIRKQIQKAPRFYFFDIGILNVLQGEIHEELSESSYRFGKLFETLVVLEIVRANIYSESDFKLFYWRTNTNIEVDLILQRGIKKKAIAIEIKSSKYPDEADTKGLLAFQSENPHSELMIFCRCENEYVLDGNIKVLPWQQGIKQLFLLTKVNYA